MAGTHPNALLVAELSPNDLPRKTTSPFEFCVFIGDPPSGYASWSDWAAEPTKRYVTIRASETKEDSR